MASRQPSTVSPFGSPVGVSGFAPRRRQSRLARWGYAAAWGAIGFAGTVGLVFSLYRNDSLLSLARRYGKEARYREIEQRLLGEPGWGTPRSLAPSPFVAVPVSSGRPCPVFERASQARAAVGAAELAARSSQQCTPEATTDAPARASTSEGVAIVSLDALPAAASAEVPVSPLPPLETPAPAAPRSAPVRAAVVAAPAPLAPAKAPAPAKAAAPAAAPKAAAPAAPPKTVAQRPAPASAPPTPAAAPAPINENPLKAAIRSAINKEAGK